MRVRARVAGLIGALAMVASLASCVTVHGETAIVPATTKDEAQRALDRWVELSNEANRDYAPDVNERIERGPMGAIDHASLRALRGLNPDGNPDFRPMELSDPEFHIPQQQGWPKFFMVDAVPEFGPDRWLLTFTRNSVEEEWYATYLTVLPEAEMPEFAEDEDGYLEDMPVGQEYPGLAASPKELSAAYTAYLTDEEGPFAAGSHTTGVLENREQENSNPEYEMNYQDEAVDPAAEPQMAPVAVRTADGGAFVAFTSRFFDRQTVAPGFTPSVDPEVEELMEGTAETSVTREWITMLSAFVPEGDGEVVIAHRVSGVVSAQGE
ncbi:hypothetical protein [Streptomyces sp. 6N223]|uniref:hypothetical protein n=1 Tax=Streptomyces sp. 6N223 TaxID=3457412 RepID=UPI003FD128F1